MTKRERYLRALRNEAVEELVWVPNFDYWLNVNANEKTLPEKYDGMSRNDIVRAIGGTIWNRASGHRTVMDKSVKIKTFEEGTAQVTEVTTPVGTIRQATFESEGKSRSRFLGEHYIKDLESLEVMKYFVSATYFEPDYEPTLVALKETGDDGIVINSLLSVPFIQFAKMDAGYMTAYYLWTDERKKVDELISLYFDKFLEAYKIVAEGPADVIATGDNMDGTMIPPYIFKEYGVPFYQELKKLTSRNGKILEGHWCGRTDEILPLTPGCGLDCVEAIVTEPMAKMTLNEALTHLKGEVVLQGGIPSVLVCEQGGTSEQFEKYIIEKIVPLQGRKGFILGMSDNVPPNADFSRVERIGALIKG